MDTEPIEPYNYYRTYARNYHAYIQAKHKYEAIRRYYELKKRVPKPDPELIKKTINSLNDIIIDEPKTGSLKVDPYDETTSTYYKIRTYAEWTWWLAKKPYEAIKWALHYGKTYWLYTALGLGYLYTVGHPLTV